MWPRDPHVGRDGLRPWEAGTGVNPCQAAGFKRLAPSAGKPARSYAVLRPPATPPPSSNPYKEAAMSNNDAMNRYIRESRSTPWFGPDATSADINAAIREAAGYPAAPPGPAARQHSSGTAAPDPRTASRQLLAEAAAEVRDSEPIAGVDTEQAWDGWVYSRPVLPLLDADGRLPGERNYDPAASATVVGSGFDMDSAIDARRHRWKQLGRI
jgi:hypothetical protein